MKAPLTQAQKSSRSLNFGFHQGERPHSLPREVEDLRSDIEEAFVALEGNNIAPVIYSSSVTAQGALAAGQGDLVALNLYGKNFLANRDKASFKLYATGSFDNYILIESFLPGTSFNAWSFVAQAGAGQDAALDLAVDEGNKVLTLHLDTDGAEAIEAAAANNLTTIKTELDATANFVKYFTATIVGDGADQVTAAISSASLSGGEGDGLSVSIKHLNANVDATIKSATDTHIELDSINDLAAATVKGQNIGVVVKSHSAESNVCFITILD
jgi:hypothetical protein